ncbi:MAG: PBP1A family penicillin-binding protein [Candidatus Gastranaerophilaceae bacterium]|jgi:1A family penicillin-binding protein
MFKKCINNLKILDKKTLSDVNAEKTKQNLLAKTLVVIIIAAISISIIFTFYIYRTLEYFPDLSLISQTSDQTTQIYDLNDKLVANIHADEDRVSVPLKAISIWLQHAVISVEDVRFYEHHGIDLIGTLRAATSNTHSEGTQGGSTLTQQLVKNSFLKPERSIKRKFVEAILAMKIENAYPKDKILEMYLNQIYWGNLCYGAEKAAKRYFKKPAKNLDLAEAALLAGLLKAPEGLSPYRNFKGAKARQINVLHKMKEYGYINDTQMKNAIKEELTIYPSVQKNCNYGYFIHYITTELRNRYGDDAIRRGGFRVYTTLDPQVQELGEKIIKAGTGRLRGNGARQGALVSINVEKGYIQAIVGGVDFDKSNFNRAFQGKRPPGSSFKPIVYLTGFRLNLITPESHILDGPISFYTGWGYWSPHNWDGRYMGVLTVRKALSLSRNTPTVRLGIRCGLDRIIQTARFLGVKGYIDRNFSILLGSFGVSPLELATAYSTFARDGVYIEPIAIRKIENTKGQLIEINNPAPVRVVESKYVRWLNSILMDVIETGTGTFAKQEGRQVAGKTGTTDMVKDVWFTGFTPDTVTSIWLGNDENQPLHGVFSFNAAQLWGEFTKEYYKIKNIPPKPFLTTDSLIKEREKSDKSKKRR